MLEPVRVGKGADQGTWTEYLVLFLRIMAGVSMVKGLYHWSQVCGIGARSDQAFEAHSIAWQTATVFFAVLDLVAAVGLWLAAAWGAVVWLTSVVSMAAVELFFPNVYGGSLFIVLVEFDAAWSCISGSRSSPRKNGRRNSMSRQKFGGSPA